MSTSLITNNPTRKYIYKIVPTDTSLPLKTTPTAVATSSDTSPNPSKLPRDYTLPASPLDTSSAYIHLSTAAQIPGTLNRFFASPASQRDAIYLLRVSLGQFAASGHAELLWEDPEGSKGEAWQEGCFPHLYFEDGRLGLRGEEVEGSVEVVSKEGEEGWEGAVGRLGGWLV